MSETDSGVCPVRTTENWDCERIDGDPSVTIQRPRQPRNRVDELLFDLFDTPTERELELDTVGSIVWCHCDGETTTAAIADELAATVTEERIEPVGDTLSYFLAQLAELDLIRYADV